MRKTAILAAWVLVGLLSTDSSAQTPDVEVCATPGSVISSGVGTLIETIDVGPAITIQDLQVQVDITHTFIGDMVIEVTSPAGTTVRLHNSDGLSADDLIVTYTDGGGPYQAPYDCDCPLMPSGPGFMSAFDLESTAGTWTLSITDDADQDDGVLNEWCVRGFTTTAPLPVSSLSCTVSPAADSADLSWTNNGTYDSIEVLLDGVLTATLAGTATSYTEPLTPGLHSFCVIAYAGGGPLGTTCCDVSVIGDATGYGVIFAGEGLAGLVDSVSAIEAALNANGVPTIRVNDLSGYTGDPMLLWLALGTWPDNYILGDDESFLAYEKIQAGVPVVIEGADRFAVDPPTILNDYDGVDSTLSEDGDGTLLGLFGRNYGPATFDGFAAPYTDDSFGTDYNDKLVPATTDAAGSNAGVIWSDDTTGGATVPYDVGVFYDTDAPFGKVISQSWEFGGYDGDRNALMAQYIDAMGTTTPTSGFRRGDANSDATFDISDAIYLLAGFFTGGPAPACADAGDANDDGGLDIADAVYVLAALFTPSSPAPPAPGPDQCGDDPTADGLDCAVACP